MSMHTYIHTYTQALTKRNDSDDDENQDAHSDGDEDDGGDNFFPKKKAKRPDSILGVGKKAAMKAQEEENDDGFEEVGECAFVCVCMYFMEHRYVHTWRGSKSSNEGPGRRE
jgi:hypothetical protein